MPGTKFANFLRAVRRLECCRDEFPDSPGRRFSAASPIRPCGRRRRVGPQHAHNLRVASVVAKRTRKAPRCAPPWDRDRRASAAERDGNPRLVVLSHHPGVVSRICSPGLGRQLHNRRIPLACGGISRADLAFQLRERVLRGAGIFRIRRDAAGFRGPSAALPNHVARQNKNGISTNRNARMRT